MAEKPTAAFVLSLNGGIFILLAGIVVAVVLGTLGALIPGLEFAAGLGIFGVICGVLVMLGGIMIYSRPAQHQMWGVIVLVFSILSWFGAIGGFFIGFLLGLIGGILGIVYKPGTAVPPPPPPAG